jgi:hypothetical protein
MRVEIKAGTGPGNKSGTAVNRNSTVRLLQPPNVKRNKVLHNSTIDLRNKPQYLDYLGRAWTVLPVEKGFFAPHVLAQL